MSRIFRLAAVLCLLWVSLPNSAPVSAGSPYTTWTLGPGHRLYSTQDAYLPVSEIILPVSSPEDLFIRPTGEIYIADTQGGQVVRLDKNFEIQKAYGNGILKSPSGIFVDKEGTLYVADAGTNTIVIFDQEGNLLTQFGRPSEALFGRESQFLPRKIAVDARQNLYVVSEGSTNGLLVMNKRGNFLGYFGANRASMSLKMILQRLFLTEEQLARFIKIEAASPSNVTIDAQSMVFTVTGGTAGERSIRRFTVDGRNIFPDSFGSTSFRDIDVSADGLAAAVDAEGKIYEYDLNGALLFVFGAKDQGDQRLGTLSNPSAIARQRDFLYVLDKDKNALVIYKTTTFARLVHEGVRLYMEGYYAKARPYFEQVLRYNSAFLMAYQAIADAHFKDGEYALALQAYRYAEDRRGYSDAFWELRNALLQRYLGSALLTVVALGLAQSLARHYDRRHGWFNGWRSAWARWKTFKAVDDFLFLFAFLKQPGDSFYAIKKKWRGSLGFALLIYLWVIFSRVASLYVTAFPFNPYANLSEIQPINEVVFVAVLIVLWNAANYLVSTISDGEGRLRDVVIGSAYALFPYALFALPLALFSNLLSLNEEFLYTFSQNLIWAWTVLMLFLMVMEIHNYSFSETLRNVLVTLFTMAMIALSTYILYVLFQQLFDFITAVLREAQLRS